MTQTTANRKWDEYLLGDTGDHVDYSIAAFRGGPDIEEYQFVGPLLVV